MNFAQEEEFADNHAPQKPMQVSSTFAMAMDEMCDEQRAGNNDE